ncbi:MAG: hypothetical protein ACLGG5_08685 [Thermoleophilia bacterium]
MIAVTFLDEESTVEEASVEIVVERLDEGGATDELQLEGSLGDARALAATLEAEGNCVTVEFAWPEGEESAEEVPGGSEEAPRRAGAIEEIPGSGEEVVEPGESPVPVTP